MRTSSPHSSSDYISLYREWKGSINVKKLILLQKIQIILSEIKLIL